MHKIIKETAFRFLAFLFGMFFLSQTATAGPAILDDVIDRGLTAAVTLDARELHQERAKGLRAYLNITPSGGIYDFYTSYGGMTRFEKTDSKPEYIVSGIVSQTYLGGAIFEYYHDNATKAELWKHNLSTNTLHFSTKCPIIQWADYRLDGGFGEVKYWGKITGLKPTGGKTVNIGLYY